MARVHLIDALPYVFRAYFSIPATMRAPDGRPVHAVYGFGMFLLKLLEDERPTHAAAAFDESLNSSFRNEILATYKASRALPPPELEAQLRDCQEMARACGLFVTADDRYEADDLIATLQRRLGLDGHECVILTSDKDLAQLVDERTSIYDFGRNERLGPDEVLAKMGVRPACVPDLLGLMGDSVDDIPGVPGIGPKTAAALIAHFGSVEAVFERLDEVRTVDVRGAKTLRAKLEPHREQALLSKRLATAAFDAPVSASLAELELKRPVAADVEAFCDRLGFTGLKKRLLRRAG